MLYNFSEIANIDAKSWLHTFDISLCVLFYSARDHGIELLETSVIKLVYIWSHPTGHDLWIYVKQVGPPLLFIKKSEIFWRICFRAVFQLRN